MKQLLFILMAAFFCSNIWAQSCSGEYYIYEQGDVDNWTATRVCDLSIEYQDWWYDSNPITNLDGLSELTYVGGDLRMYDNDDLINLNGLQNLDTIMGDLYIGYHRRLEDFSGLSNLKFIGGDVIIINNDGLKNFEGLNSLTYIGGEFEIGGFSSYSGEGNDRLSNLSGLNNLTYIGGNLKVRNNKILKNLSGLENLTSINSSLWITNNTTLNSIAALQNLTSINGIIYIYKSALTNLNGLENIDYTGITSLQLSTNSQLSTCNILSVCNYLENGATTYIGSNATGCDTANEIANACGLSSPCPFGTTRFSTQQEIDDFATNYPNCTELPSVIIRESSDSLITNLNGLSQVTSIEGELQIDSNTKLTDLSGLSNLNSIGERLSLSSNALLSDLSALSNVTSSGLDLNIYYLPNLTSLSGLGNMIPDDLSIRNCHTLTDLTGIGNFSNLSGNLYFESNSALSSFTGLENLHTVGGNVHIEGHRWFDDSLKTLSGFNNLSSIGGYLEITEINNVSNLTGLESLTHVGTSISITENDALTSLTGIENLILTEANSLTIQSNYNLSVCTQVCNYIEDVGNISISGNASGCSSNAEVLNICHGVVQQTCIPAGITFTTQQQIDDFATDYPGCTQVLGDVTIADGQSAPHNESITDLTGLSQLRSIDGTLTIRYNHNLTTLKGLDSLNHIGELNIWANRDLYFCNVSSICDHIANGGTASINNNYEGCDSNTEVTDACANTDDCPSDNIEFSTQRQIDNFPILYPNCTEITGNLIIGGGSSLSAISDLSPLSQITSVEGELNITNNRDFTNLTGLDNLSSVGMGLSISGNNSLTDLTALNKLNSIGGTFHLRYNHVLENLTGLDNLTSIAGDLQIIRNNTLSDISSLENIAYTGIDDLEIYSNPQLGVCNISNICNYFDNAGQAKVYNNATGCSNTVEIVNACGITPPCPSENVVLLTQQEVDDFAILYPTCTEIIGNLNIGRYHNSRSNINNLSPLNNLTSIGGNLLIADNDSLMTLTGLDKLTSVGEDLILAGNGALTNLTGLTGLTSVGRDLTVSGNNALTDLTGLDNLTSIGRDMRIHTNEQLVNYTGLNSLTTIGNDFYLDNYYYGNNSNNNIENLVGLESLMTIGGDFIVNDNPKLIDFTGLENLQTIEGDLHIGLTNEDYYYYPQYIGNDAMTSFTGLSSLNKIGGDFTIKNNQALVNIKDMVSLDSIGGYFTVYNNNSLVNFTGLESLKFIGKGFTVGRIANFVDCSGYTCYGTPYKEGNDALVDFTGLEQLNHIGIGLSITDNNALVNLSGLSGLNTIGSLSIYANGSLNSLTGLDNLHTVEGNLTIGGVEFMYVSDYDYHGDCHSYYSYQGNPALTDLSGLNKLTTIGGNLSIGDNNALVNLSGLDNVTSVGGSFEVYKNDNLTDLTGMEKLSTIGGSFSLADRFTQFNLVRYYDYGSYYYVCNREYYYHGNEQLADLTALSNLTSIGGSILITDNNTLTSLTGLDNIDRAGISGLSIFDNTELSICSVKSICDYLGNGGQSTINGNATGCNDDAEVELFCTSSPACPPGDVTLSSQQQVDNFPVLYPNCTEITGNLHIGGTPDESTTINDLTSLSQLTSIQGKLTIAKNDSLMNLSGLENLNTIGGDVYIGHNPVLSSLANWNNLTSIGGSLIVRKNALSDLTGFNNLTYIGKYLNIGPSSTLTTLSGLENVTIINDFVYVQGNSALNSLTGLDNIDHTGITNLKVTNNPQLSICNVQSICDYLSNGGTSTINNNAPGCSTRSEVITSCTPCPQGNIVLRTQQDIDDFPINHPNCTEITGDLHIGGTPDAPSAINDLAPLSQLTSIQGKLTIAKNDALTSLSGLENLNTIGGDIYIGFNPVLSSLTNWNNLTSTGGSLIIRQNALTDLTGFNNLTSIGRYLNIGPSPTLTSLSGLESLTTINGFVYVQKNPTLNSLTGLDNIDHTTITNLKVLNNPQLNVCNVQSVCDYLENGSAATIGGNASGCNSQAEVEAACTSLTICPQGDVIFIHQQQIDDFPVTYPECTTISGDLTIAGSIVGFIDNLTPLSQITEVQGNLTIGENFGLLQNLSGLENITSIGGELNINNNYELTSLQGIENIDPNTITNLVIYGNNYISECDLPLICNYLENGGTASISVNASGCNSQAEVEAACTSPDNPCGQVDTLSHIFDQDLFIDGVGFANNPTITFTDPATDADAVLSEISLELYFRLNGSSCENEIAIQITDPAGNTQPLTAYTTCDGGTGLYYVNLNVPYGNTTGEIDDWLVEFDDTNDQNAGYEYSVRFARLNYVATDGGVLITTTNQVSEYADADIFVDGVGFANNDNYTFSDPGTPTDAVLSNISLELYFRLNGSSCENEIAIQITDPAGNTQPLTAYTTCDGGTDLYYVNLDVPNGSTIGSVADWVVEFDDTNDQNTDYEYSVRFGRLTYDTEYTECVISLPLTEESSPIDPNISTSARQQVSTLKLYPVPASQYLNVEYFSDNANSANIEILSNKGKTLMTEKAALQEGLNTIQMDIAHLPAGHYHIRMYNSNDVRMQSFIKIAP